MQGMINLWYRGGGALILQVFESRLVQILQACISQAKSYWPWPCPWEGKSNACGEHSQLSSLWSSELTLYLPQLSCHPCFFSSLFWWVMCSRLYGAHGKQYLLCSSCLHSNSFPLPCQTPGRVDLKTLSIYQSLASSQQPQANSVYQAAGDQF